MARYQLTALLDGAARTGLSNGDFPVEVVRALNTLIALEDRGFRIIARGPDARESPVAGNARRPTSRLLDLI